MYVYLATGTTNVFFKYQTMVVVVVVVVVFVVVPGYTYVLMGWKHKQVSLSL